VVADLAPRGVLRASINLGNPVLAQGTPAEPAGVTVDIARELAARLGVPVEFACFDAARKSFEALLSGTADICFLAIEPARAAEVAFSAPYVLIEGVYVVPDDSPLVTAEDADQDGIRIGVKEGSAYDLYLSRTLRHATVVRGDEGTDVFVDGNLDAGAGIREPATEFVASHPGYRLLDGRGSWRSGRPSVPRRRNTRKRCVSSGRSSRI
jgi:polar amino acid transport system substrate-binding protein